MNAQKDKKTSKKLKQLLETNANSGTGHSDHRGWTQGQHESQGKRLRTAQSGTSLLDGIGAARTADLPIQEQNIEEMVQQAIGATKNAGSVPGNILDLSAKWLKARQPAVDWKRNSGYLQDPMANIQRSLHIVKKQAILPLDATNDVHNKTIC